MALAKGAPESGAAANLVAPQAVAFWRDERKRGILAQIVVIALLAGFFWFLLRNFLIKQELSGAPPLSLYFLQDVAGFQLSFSLFPLTLDSPIGRLIAAGALNTLIAAFFAGIIATFLGLIVGIARLSKNWLISHIAATYIEIIRNIPLLLQLVFWYGGVLTALPKPKDSISLFEAVFLNIKGLFLPMPILQEGVGWFFMSIAVCIGLAIVIGRWARARQMATGQQFPTVIVNTAVIVLLPSFVFILLHDPIGWEFPIKGAFNFKGGLTVQPEMTALIIGIGISTAAYVAEIVRAGINSVSHGQSEAAHALGLKSSWTLRLVVLPQALRVIIPPMISQYLNVVKNSTLAGFIGYADLFAVIGTSQNQTGRAVECVIILMVFYLTISLIISTIMNVYNKRAALVER
ncbi:amino acid ABC transporter permease [Dongia mobilis]|jgi:general L-amino acid transport system permease protein|uniref:amino acid ABC transporter permease n=1 Tax=Dongia sp. TaxID=1977262 RepID=UPI0026F1ACE7